MFDAEITELATEVLDACRKAGLTLATVESCTGGLIAGALTAIPGSSDVVNGGLVTYSNMAKSALAGVPAELIEAHGAVSEPVARAMAEGAGCGSLPTSPLPSRAWPAPAAAARKSPWGWCISLVPGATPPFIASSVSGLCHVTRFAA